MNYSQGAKEQLFTSNPHAHTGEPGRFEAPQLEPRPGAPIRPLVSPQLIKRFQWLMGIYFAIHLSYLLFLQTQNVEKYKYFRIIDDFAIPGGALICAIVCIYALIKISQRRLDRSNILVRRAWIAIAFMAAAAITYTTGQLIWTWYEAMFTTFPFPAAYDPFFIAVYPFSWISLALIVPRGGTVAGRTRLLLDAGIVVTSVLAVSWYFILGPTLNTLNGPVVEKFVALAYPLGDLSLCVAAALLLFGPAGATSLGTTLRRIAIGVTILAITDSLYSLFQLQGIYHTGFIEDAGWPISWLFIGWAILGYVNDLERLTGQRVSRETVRPTRLRSTAVVLRVIMPITLAIITCALLLLEIAIDHTFPLIQVALVCMGLLVLPIIRQVLTLIDNMMLNERLHIALDQSQQAFQASQQELLNTAYRAEQVDELCSGIENIQAVHAALARGDMNTRAIVQGPLSPVAQSLNLLIERINRWSQMVQQSQIMEREARLLNQELEALNQGQLITIPPTTRSPLPTGESFLLIANLQNSLRIRFRQMRDTTDILHTRMQALTELINHTQQVIAQSSPEQRIQEEQMLSQIEKGLQSNQQLLHDLWQQGNIYTPAPHQTSTPGNEIDAR